MDIAAFHKRLLKWYAHNGRSELLWRNLEHDKERAYKVYVSEMMLQQTQVQTVIPYYIRFTERFKNIHDLANATEQDVLYQWQGLGYYSRARFMHKAAKLCATTLPSDIKMLMQLPGIGRYSAGAIACFGFGKAVHFVDSNIKRVLCRLFALSSPTHSELDNLAKMLLNTDDAFSHNQALLDIGALICKAKNPACIHCPLESLCKGKANAHNYPTSKPKKIISKEIMLGLFYQKHHIALIQSQTKLYHGLYNLPHLLPCVKQQLRCLGQFKHRYTTYKLDVFVYDVNDLMLLEPCALYPIAALKSLPLSQLCHKALQATLKHVL